jgi:hypothetical protein
MTIIAAFEVDHTPILVGDLLLTTPGPPSRPASTPLVHAPNSIIGNQQARCVSGVCQKLVLLHDHLCIAWAGSWLHARMFCEYILSFSFGKNAIDYGELRSFIEAYPESDLRGCIDFILYSWHGAGWGYFSNLKPFDLDPIHNIRVSGTGTEHFVQTISVVSNSTIEGNLDRYNDLVMRALAYAGVASSQQYYTGIGLHEWWGGGFEVAVFKDLRLVKLGPICWLYWVCKQAGQCQYVVELQKTFMYQFHRDDITYFLLDEDASGENKLYAITPPYSAKAPCFDRPDRIDTGILVNLYWRALANGETGNGCFIIQTKPGDQLDFDITKNGDKTAVRFNAKFLRKLLGGMSLSRGDTVLVKAWELNIPWQME